MKVIRMFLTLCLLVGMAVLISGCGHGGMWSHFGNNYGSGPERHQNYGNGNRVYPNPAYIPPAQGNGIVTGTVAAQPLGNDTVTGSFRELSKQ